ncbi:Regulator of G-protein signaling RGS protein [Dioscorea alata]|uniref:Regulator of G-protein signaling RGS protein n=1 Tax=Dioscorea alata TaxID=55571 RepID=A0ACB7W1Z1_DIOAL|nr:Regulator of G-protein signaling RGS protein [Dioscorea alata]
MASCALRGGCPSDYLAITFSVLSITLLFARASFPFLVHRDANAKSSGFWLVIIQIIGSFNLLLSLLMSVNYFRWNKQRMWQSCYIWAVWVEGPFGFGLLLSCRIVQAFKLYHVFVKRRFLPVRSRVLLPLIILPWIGGAAFIHISKPLNHHCHMSSQWVVPVVCIHGFYIAVLIGVTMAVRHIEFKFHEFKDLLRGIVVSSIAVGLWIAAYILNDVHEDILWVQVASRFFLLVTASIMVLLFFSMSVSQPLLSQISLRRRDLEFPTMGQALGIPGSGSINQKATISTDLSQPLEKLLADKRFCLSFMAFADSCLAGESIHFYDEVSELSNIPLTDPVTRVYMARHIIEKYIVSGAEMEVNISHKTRQEILNTLDIAHTDLFNHAINEIIHLMKTNLVNDYWSSVYSVRFKEEALRQHDNYKLEQMVWDFSPRLSSVQCSDDPFQQDHINRCSSARKSYVLDMESR